MGTQWGQKGKDECATENSGDIRRDSRFLDP
jgi:hypothetical protein